MNGKTGKKVENMKNWVAPQLKKIDVELITAASPGARNDGVANTS